MLSLHFLSFQLVSHSDPYSRSLLKHNGCKCRDNHNAKVSLVIRVTDLDLSKNLTSDEPPGVGACLNASWCWSGPHSAEITSWYRMTNHHEACVAMELHHIAHITSGNRILRLKKRSERKKLCMGKIWSFSKYPQRVQPTAFLRYVSVIGLLRDWTHDRLALGRFSQRPRVIR